MTTHAEALRLAREYAVGTDDPRRGMDNAEVLARALLASHAELERMRSVVEAAREWADSDEADKLLPKRAELRLLEAIDALEEGK